MNEWGRIFDTVVPLSAPIALILAGALTYRLYKLGRIRAPLADMVSMAMTITIVLLLLWFVAVAAAFFTSSG